MDLDGADAAGRAAQIGDQLGGVAATGQGGAGLLPEASLEQQAARRIGVRCERVREAEAERSRLLDGFLRVHAKLDYIEEDLDHRLGLRVATGRTEGQERPAFLERQGRVRRQAGPLARLE